MDSLFSNATVLLSIDYVTQFSIESLMSKLRKVRRETGIAFKKVKKTFALAGSFDMIEEAFKLLKLWIEDPALEPQDNCVIGEFEQIEKLHNEILWKNAHKVVVPSNAFGNIKPSPATLQEHLICVDKIKQELEEETKVLTGKQCLARLKNGTGNNLVESTSVAEPSSDIIPSETDNINSDQAVSKLGEQNKYSSDKSTFILKTRIPKHEAVKYDQKNNKLENVCSDKDIHSQQPQTTSSVKITDEDKTGYKIWQRTKRKKKNSNVNQDIQCNSCSVVLKSKKRLNEHIKRVHMKQFKCSECEKRFGYPTDLHRHKCSGKPEYNSDGTVKSVPKKANVPELFPCKECNYMATSKKRYNEHIKRKHKLSFRCEVCDKLFGLMKDLNRHKHSVHAEASYFCDKCSSFYKSKALYDQHMRTHEEGYVRPNFTCEICDKSFTTKYVMSTHIKSEHLGIKRMFQCSQCGKKFRQRNSYKMHMNAHLGIKPYVCDLCGKSFSYHKSLKEHKYMHETFKRFQCKLCSKHFRQKTTLHIHMKTHTAAKDHVCSTCGRGFKQKQALKRHERIHTGSKPYTCLLCKRSFGDASTIRRHMIAIHKKSSDGWRDDVVSVPKPKSDYYIEGGSGPNRSYTRKNTSNSSESQNMAQKDGLEQHTCRVLDSEPEFTAQPYHSSATCIPMQQQENTNEGTDGQVQNVYSNSLQYSLPTAVTETSDRTLENTHCMLPAYNVPPDYVSNIQSHDDVSMQSDFVNGIYHRQHVSQNSASLSYLAPLTGVTDITVPEPQQVSTQTPGDSILSQAMSNIWGYSGYPTYSMNVDPSSYTTSHGHQS